MVSGGSCDVLAKRKHHESIETYHHDPYGDGGYVDIVVPYNADAIIFASEWCTCYSIQCRVCRIQNGKEICLLDIEAYGVEDIEKAEEVYESLKNEFRSKGFVDVEGKEVAA